MSGWHPGQNFRDVRAIACMSMNRVIGDSKALYGLPWDCPEDLKRFRRLTEGGILVMGRKTWELVGRELKGRENVVLTSSAPREGMLLADWRGRRWLYPRFETVLKDFAADPRTIWIAGGVEVYKSTMAYWRTVELTILNREVSGDTTMPPFEHLVEGCADAAQFEDGWFMTYNLKRERPAGV